MKSAARRDGESFATREEWLMALAGSIEPLIKRRSGLSTKPYRIACGWPSRKGTSHNHRRIGECWNGQDRSGVAEMFISPTLDDVAEVAHVTAHEMLHAFLPPGVGHRKQFSRAAKSLGLIGKPTETVAGEELIGTLKKITDRLGPYPHNAIEVGPPRDRCRNLKFQCAGCGYLGRSSAYWLDNYGPPICPQCRETMIQGDDIEVETVLEIVNNITEMKLPGNDRFRIMRSLNGKSVTWTIIDYDAEDASAFSYLTSNPDGSLMPVRHTQAESRENALEIIEGLMTGLTTYEMLLEDYDQVIEDATDEFLAEDEDEESDYPEDHDAEVGELAEVNDRRRTALEQMKVAA